MRLLQQDNIGSHYRTAIYQLMDKELGCDFCFGDKWNDVKKMDYELLSNRVVEVQNKIIGGGFYYQKGILSQLRANYDIYIMIGETRCLSTWIFCILARLFYPCKKVFFWTHGWYGKETNTEKLVKKLFLRLPSGGVFLYGNYAREIMINEGFDPHKLHVIHNSLNYDAQFSIRQLLQIRPLYQEHFGNDNRNIVFIGRLTKVKRFDLLIEAVSKLNERNEKVNVTFIGDGIERHNIEVMVEERNLKEQVWFYGECYDERTNADLIFNADLCVSPGNIGLTAMHVMMFGCPALTNDDLSHQMPEFESIHEGRTGSFFRAGDSMSLANAISNWFANHGDDREKVRKACYEEIDNRWNPHNQIKLLKAVLSV